MFCTKCGKELREGDNFCAYCGNKAREVAVPEINMGKYSEVVFNPPFKLEAQRRTEEISQEVKQYSQEPKRESLQFDWNLDGFPGSKRKQDEDFKFNWDDVLEKKKDSRAVDVEKILFVAQADKKEEIKEEAASEYEVESKEEVPEIKISEEKPSEEEAPVKEVLTEKSEKNSQYLSIEELEKELFGEAPEADEEKDDDLTMTRRYEGPKDKFYTYNAKKDAFQELLDKERERVQKMESERKEQWEELTHTAEQKEKVPTEVLSFEEVFREPKIFTGNILKEVAVELPPLTAVVMAEEENPENKVAETEVKKEMPPFQEEGLASKDKTKLRFSDVFPREAFDTDDSGDNDDSDVSAKEEQPIEQEEKEIVPEEKESLPAEKNAEDKNVDAEEDEASARSKNPVLKALITILMVLVIAELIIIGVKLVAPNSAFSKKVDSIVANISAVFTGEESETELISGYIDNIAGSVANIDKIEESTELTFGTLTTFAFDEVAESKEFTNSIWIENPDGSVITYGQGIVEGLITYYDQLETNKKLADGLVGINKLEIGEIRTGGKSYFVLCKVTYEGEDGDVIKVETALMEAGSQLVKVKKVKEETL